MAKYGAADVASHIVAHCIERGDPISNLQLQKILYFVQERWISKNGLPLFDDQFEAWQYGPVVPSVYQAYSIFGRRPIFQEARYVSNGLLNPVGREIVKLDEDTAAAVDEVTDCYSGMSPWELVDIAHKKDGPWYDAYHDSGRGAVITKSSIARHPCGVF